ncbi:hypothetical protein Pfo_019113 [Paulownia fortunei]|nr:hypothetical protein Pfo_019113 [Paulownia fortunei]
MDVSLSKLLKKLEHIETKIREYCLSVSKLPCFVVPNTAVDSLFIVNSLVNDLEDLLNRDYDLIVDVWDGIGTLQEELMLLRSFVEVFKEQHHAELVFWIRDAAYEAEYLINSFVVGGIPIWYLTLRLPDVIQKIKLIGIRLEEIKKNYNDVKYLISSFMVGDVPVWYLKLRLPDVVDNIKVISMGPEEIKIDGAQIGSKDPSEEVASQDKKISIDDIVVGFQDEATIIADQLAGGPKQLQVISIFGMPGLGKTTLAKKLYNDPAVFY